jgi:post-segregation antitoxin (ccd killing protein)
MPMKKASSDVLQSNVTVRMPYKLREDARDLGVNLSETLRIALAKKINDLTPKKDSDNK